MEFIIYLSIALFFAFAGLWFLTIAVKEIFSLICEISLNRSFKKSYPSLDSSEIPSDSENVSGRYDIDAYNKRISFIADEDGLYNIPFEPAKTDFTGTEIITDSFESVIDERIGENV